MSELVKLQYFKKVSFGCNSEPFWKACKSYDTNKNSNMKENMFEKGKLLKVKDVASTFNKRFGSITESLNFFSDPKILQYHQGMTQLAPLLKKLPFTQV